MVTNQYVWLLGILKLAYGKKKSSIRIRCYSNKIIKLLNILLDISFISNYNFIDKNTLIIYLRYSNKTFCWHNIHICYSPSSDHSVSASVIRKTLIHDRKIVFIVSTSRGLVHISSSNLTTILDNSCLLGGKPVCILS